MPPQRTMVWQLCAPHARLLSSSRATVRPAPMKGVEAWQAGVAAAAAASFLCAPTTPRRVVDIVIAFM
jgi:hypothetical protein